MQAWGEELEFAFRLADTADAVSTERFLSEELRRTHKPDGTPVSQIDFDVEEAMLEVIRDIHPADSVLGEEIGQHRGSSERRWIVDGIDGTHNYALGRPGWGTAISCEVGGEIVAGVVSCPEFGRRVWATRGGGAWSAPYGESGVVDRSEATRMRCSNVAALDDAVVSVMPWEGFLVGWRNQLCRRFPPPPSVRSQSIVLDTVAAAAGEIDVVILTLGELWDYAGSSLILSESGGVFCDAWGGTSFHTNTAIMTNAVLQDQVLEVIAEYRPAEPDRATVARTVSEPLGTVEEQALDPWRSFGIRPMPSMSARVHVYNDPPEVRNIIEERMAELDRPFVGITTDGLVRGGLRSLDDMPRVGTEPITEAALAFLQALTPEQRSRATYPIDAIERRMWINVHMNHFRHGVMLEDLRPPIRELALGILRETLSARGYHQARSIMRVNQFLAEISGDLEAFGEWPYFLTIFGRPSDDEPWSWQIDGHHLCLNFLVVDGRMVMTPAFMGAEPRRINTGSLAGLSLFDPEEETGLALVRSLDTSQRSRAVLYPSIDEDDISPLLQNMFDGRMVAGAFHDNLVAPCQGIAGSDLTDAQRRVLVQLAATYVGWSSDRHAEVKMSEVEAHLDETWFSWYGGIDDVSPFYYRVHSPVVLIEFDHHPGVVFDNETPTRYHVHTVVRTPNGGDYGTDLLGQHHERYDHSHGDHRPRD